MSNRQQFPSEEIQKTAEIGVSQLDERERQRQIGLAALAEIYEIMDYCPWGAIWSKLNQVQRRGVLIVSGIEPVGINSMEWVNFTLAETQKIKRTISTFAGIGEKVRRALNIDNAAGRLAQ